MQYLKEFGNLRSSKTVPMLILLVFALAFSSGCNETTVGPTEPNQQEPGNGNNGNNGNNGGEQTTITVSFTATPVANTTTIQVNGQFSPTDVDPIETWQYTLLDGEEVLATKSGQSVDFSTQDQPNPCKTFTIRLDVTLKDGFVLPNPPPSQAVTIPEDVCADPPAASFTTTINGLDVTFTNTTTGSFDDSDWNFGDGTGSTATSPTHTYPAAGSYTVQLIVTGPGGSDTETVTINVS